MSYYEDQEGWGSGGLQDNGESESLEDWSQCSHDCVVCLCVCWGVWGCVNVCLGVFISRFVSFCV